MSDPTPNFETAVLETLTALTASIEELHERLDEIQERLDDLNLPSGTGFSIED